jgi:hypothetical protein
MNELERLRMENFALRINLLQQQLQQTARERMAFIETLEREHPGYEWDEQRGFVQKEELEEALT